MCSRVDRESGTWTQWLKELMTVREENQQTESKMGRKISAFSLYSYLCLVDEHHEKIDGISD